MYAIDLQFYTYFITLINHLKYRYNQFNTITPDTGGEILGFKECRPQKYQNSFNEKLIH